MGKKGGKVAAKRLSPEQRMARAAKGGEATRARFMEKISIDRTTLENNMDVLDERERRIIIEYFGLSGEQPKSLRCTAKTTGLTAQRVHQLLNITLDEIKECQSKRGA